MIKKKKMVLMIHPVHCSPIHFGPHHPLLSRSPIFLYSPPPPPPLPAYIFYHHPFSSPSFLCITSSSSLFLCPAFASWFGTPPFYVFRSPTLPPPPLPPPLLLLKLFLSPFSFYFFTSLLNLRHQPHKPDTPGNANTHILLLEPIFTYKALFILMTS